MAFVTRRAGGGWEIRESRSTARGPRSRTLATFGVLTPEIIERALARSERPLSAADLRLAAVRAGAPVTPQPSDRAAGELLAELARGRGPRAALRELLLAELTSERNDKPSARRNGKPSDNARAAGAWIATTPAQRGAALRDLLLLADRLPVRRSRPQLRFPRIHTAPA